MTTRARRRQQARTGRDALTAAAVGAPVWQVANRSDDPDAPIWEARHGDTVIASASDRHAAVDALLAAYMGDAALAASAGFAPAGPEFVARFVEGEETRDGGGFTRIIDAGATRFDRPFPLPIMATTATSWGHEGAELVGIITDGSVSSPNVEMRGRFDTSDRAREIARMVGDGVLTRHSPDLGSDVTDFECTEYEDDEWGGWCVAGTLHFTEATVLGTTILPFPALDSATIELVEPADVDDTGDDEDEVEPAMAASGAPALLAAARVVTLPAVPRRAEIDAAIVASARDGAYPAAHFEAPRFDGPTAPHVTPDGRYLGHLACWGTCHIGQPEGADVCTTPPRADDGYSAFHSLGPIRLANGTEIRVGGITVGTGHASRYGITPDDAAAHYDNTGTLAAVVRAGEDEWGIWVAGAVAPNLDDWTLWQLEVASLSGDWRRFEPGGPLRLVAALGVNVPGFPIPDVASITAGGECQALIAAGARTMALVASAQRPVLPDAPPPPADAVGRMVEQRLAKIERELARIGQATQPLVIDQLARRVDRAR